MSYFEDERILAEDARLLPLQVEAEALAALPSPSHLAVYLAVLKLCRSEGNTAPGQQALATTAGVGLTTAKRCLRDLEALGVIVRLRRRAENGTRLRTVFRVLGIHGQIPTMAPRSDSDHGSTVTSRPWLYAGKKSDLDPQEKEINTPLLSTGEAGALVDELRALGVFDAVAVRLVADSPDEVARQLAALKLRSGVLKPAVTIVKAVRERWPVPAPRSIESFMPADVEHECDSCAGNRLVEHADGWATCAACC